MINTDKSNENFKNVKTVDMQLKKKQLKTFIAFHFKMKL